MILLEIDPDDPEPIYRQIMEGLQERIESRAIRPGDRLPSTRRMADALGIHRSTVAVAYQELWARGYLNLHPGARPRVRDRVPLAERAPAEEGLVDWAATSSAAGRAAMGAYERVHARPAREADPSRISFRSLDMDARLFPVERFRSSLGRVLRTQAPAHLGYGDHAGYGPLREYIAHRLKEHNVVAGPDEILITNGSQQAIDLVFRMMAGPGAAVAIESPTYDHMLPLLAISGLKAVEIPVRDDGMDLSVLAERLEDADPVLVYTMPTFHNPTGVTTEQAHRERLLSLCQARGIPLLEDGFDEEMKYFGRAVLPIKSMDTRGIVIYCGTFSKVLFPGVRIGWIVAERECIERLKAMRCFVDLASNTVLQAGIHEFCRGGYYDRHVSRMHRSFRRRMQTALHALREHIAPEWAEWTEPNGGYLIWLKLKPVPNPPADWDELFATHGVEVAPGHRFYHSAPARTFLRLSISTLNEAEIVDGVQRLSRALSHAFGRNGS